MGLGGGLLLPKGRALSASHFYQCIPDLQISHVGENAFAHAFAEPPALINLIMSHDGVNGDHVRGLPVF